MILTEPIHRAVGADESNAVVKKELNSGTDIRETEKSSDVATSASIEPRRPVQQYIPGGSWDYGGSSKEAGVSKDVKEILFVITNKSTIQDLEEIKELARTAGIDFNYKVKGSIRWINLKMTLDNEHGKSQTQLTMDGVFEMCIGWWENEDGQATGFSSGEEDGDGSIFTVDDGPLFDPGEPPTPPTLEIDIDVPDVLINGSAPIPPIPGRLDGKAPVIEDGQEKVIVHIDRSTTNADIKRYTTQADNAGLDLDIINFKPTGKSIKVKLRGPESMMSIRTEVDTRKDPMEITFGWVIDAAGDFVRNLEREELVEEE